MKQSVQDLPQTRVVCSAKAAKKQTLAVPLEKQGVNVELSLGSLVEIAKAAGDGIMSHYNDNGDLNIHHKSDDSPVTVADLTSHNVIVRALTKLTPNIPIMSEEASDIDWSTRKSWSVYWLIDPLDGTKEFINKNGEFTVNIALISGGKPIAGVVYAPVLAKCYFGAVSLGAWLEIECENQSSQVVALNAKASSHRETPILVGSRSHPSPDLAEYLDTFGRYQMLSVGSSLKFCMLAEGLADVYPRLGPTSEWDTAAAQAVLESAGGKVLCYQSDVPLSYNQKPSLLNPYFIATSADC